MIGKAALALAALLVGTAMASSPAWAVSQPSATPNDNPTHPEYRGINKTFEGAYSGDWTRCNYASKEKGSQTIGCTEGKSVTETIMGNVGYNADDISQVIGFSVAYSSIVTATNNVKVKAGGYGWFDVGFRYNRYEITMQSRQCPEHGNCSAWGDSDTVTVQQHLGPTSYYFGTGQVKS